jgi:tRNA/rRNA methyltransferase
MASGAGRVLDHAMVVETTEAAVADLNFVYATTARPREMIKTVMTPARAVAHASELTAEGQRVGFLFGRERTGLENDDVVRANAIVTVPCNPVFASLNLAQCVLLVAYEWRQLADATPPESYQTGRTELAASDDVARMLGHLEDELDGAGFFFPPEKRPSMLANLRNIFRRAPLTDQDVRTLRGVIRALVQGRRSGQR